MTRQHKEDLLREAVDILIKLDNHLMTSRDNAEFSQWVEDLIDSYCEKRERGECPYACSRSECPDKAESVNSEKWVVAFNHGEAFSTARAYIIAECRTSREAFATALCHMANSLMYEQNVDTWQVSVKQIQNNTFILRCTYDYPGDDNPEPDFFEYNISPLV